MHPRTEHLIDLALEEDAGLGDVTSRAIFAHNHRTSAYIEAKQDLVICGLEVAAGDLEGEFVVSGEVLLRAGGILRGSLRCAHLTVEDGASLAAQLQIGGGDPIAHSP